MNTAEKTYTFRAPAELGERIREAGAVLDDLVESYGPDAPERIARQLALSLCRGDSRFREGRDNQSAFVRDSVELVVGAAEKLASDLHYVAAYAEVASDRTPDEAAVRLATRAKTSERWRKA